MNQHQHKILSALIISAISFLGFEALSFIAGIYQIRTYFSLAIYIYLFHVFWIAFVFDLHLKNRAAVDLADAHFRRLISKAFALRFAHFLNGRYLRHYLNYLLLPALLYWSVIILIFLNPFKEGFKQILIVASSFALTIAYWHMKEHISSRLENRLPWLKVLAGIKLYGAFLCYAALFGLVWYFGLNRNFLFYFAAGSTFLLIYQALYQYGFHSPGLLFFVLFCSVILGLAAIWVYGFWSVEYLTAALVLLAVYNTLWGFIHHYLDRTLSMKIVIEYLVLALVVLSIVFATHNFGTRIV